MALKPLAVAVPLGNGNYRGWLFNCILLLSTVFRLQLNHYVVTHPRSSSLPQLPIAPPPLHHRHDSARLETAKTNSSGGDPALVRSRSTLASLTPQGLEFLWVNLTMLNPGSWMVATHPPYSQPNWAWMVATKITLDISP